MNRKSAASALEAANVSDRFISRKLTHMLNDNNKSKNEEKVSVILSETATETLLWLPSLVISNETREVVAIEERNSKYEAIIESHKNLDGFSSRPTQTLNNSQKNQNDMAAPNASQDFGCQASAYDISDALAGARVTSEGDGFGVTEEAHDERLSGLTPYVRKFVRDTVGVSVATPGCLLDVTDLNRPNPVEVGPAAASKGQGKDPRSSRRNNAMLSGGASMSNANAGSGSGNHGVVGQHSSAVVGDGSGSRPSDSGAVAGNNLGGASSNFAQGDVSDEDAQDTRQSERQSDTGEGSHSDPGTQSSAAPDGRQLLREREAAAIMTGKALIRKLQLVERTVLQNIYHRQHLDYRDLPDVQPLVLASKDGAQVVDSADQLFGSLGIGSMTMAMGATMGQQSTKAKGKGKAAAKNKTKPNTVTTHTSTGEGTGTDPPEAEETPGAAAGGSPAATLPKLFCYRAESVVRGRPVTALAWNSANADLLAVGYGRVDFSLDGGQRSGKGVAVDEEIGGGLVLFWSLRNPEHPEKVLRTPHPVTALDFSKRQPTLLALGLYSGDVSVYDVRREADWGKPVQTSAGMEGGHADPIWYVEDASISDMIITSEPFLALQANSVDREGPRSGGDLGVSLDGWQSTGMESEEGSCGDHTHGSQERWRGECARLLK